VKARINEIMGRRYGRWLVIGPPQKNTKPTNSHAFFLCRCDCGTVRYTSGYKLLTGTSKSCGCTRKEAASKRLKKDLLGQRFDRLVVVEEEPIRTKRGKVRWKCLCDCGNTRTFASFILLKGGADSCGCKTKERLIALGKSVRTLPDEAYAFHPSVRKTIYLTDSYICGLITQESPLENSDIPEWLIKKKREYLQLYRDIKKLNRLIREVQNGN